MVAIKQNFGASFNYTKRKKIGLNNTVKVVIISRNTDSIDISISYDRQAILQDAKIKQEDIDKVEIVLDAIFLKGERQRFTLSMDKNVLIERIDNCPDHVVPRFRLIAVDTSDKTGILIAATTFFSPAEGGSNDNSFIKKDDFLHIEISKTLDGKLWDIDWGDSQNPIVYMNDKLHRKYEQTSREMRALIFPSLVRELLTGIILNNENLDELEESSYAFKWLLFCEQKLSVNFDFDSEEEEVKQDEKLERVEEAVTNFCNMKVHRGKTFLDELAGGAA